MDEEILIQLGEVFKETKGCEVGLNESIFFQTTGPRIWWLCP